MANGASDSQLSAVEYGGDVLTLEEVAEMTRAPLSTVRFWARTGRLRSYRPGRRRLVFRIDLLKFIRGDGVNQP